MKIKRLITAVSAAALTAAIFPCRIHADEDFSDTTYWTDRCTDVSNLRGGDKENCEAFIQKMAEQSTSLSSQLTEIDSQRTTIAANIEEYEKKIADYQKQVDDLKVQIDDIQVQIDDLQKQIEEQQAKADDLQTKVKNQIENSQSTMRLSKIIDVLMGAKTFTELIQIINGLSDMTKYNDRTLQDLITVMQELQASKDQLDTKQAELESTQEAALVSQYQAQVIQEEYEAQKEQLDQQYSEVQLSAEALAASTDAVAQAQQEAAAQEAAEAAARAAEEARRKQEEEEAKRQQAQQQAGSSGSGTSSGGGSSSSSDSSSGSSSSGGSASADALTLGAQIVQYAMQFVGYPYVWGAMSPSVGFDCSGLTSYVYGHFGIYLSHSSAAQASAGRIVSLSEAIPGDLVTWNGHAAIYIGNNMVVNAMNPSMGVRTCPLSWITNGNRKIHRLF